ncbi:MAG: alpha/beta fold hydrolase, partial [Humibacillus sp.]|nr:alpha/beta fold hydrolase [Humibacillus sp.]
MARISRRLRLTCAAVLAGLTLTACTGAGGTTAVTPPSALGAASASPTPSPSAGAPSTPVPASSRPRATATSPAAAPNPVSIAALIQKTYDGRGLTLGAERGSTAAYRQYYATFRGDGLTISGRINIPRGAGPFPAVVLAHGYVDPREYTNGQTMLRERDYLARQGYVTLHVDYRNHAQSSKDPKAESRLRLGYTVDTINAALALQKDPRVDPDRIALVGRSMGGGVVYNAVVVRPGLFKAAVAYAPVSSDAVDNFEKWVRPDPSGSGVAEKVIARLGTPEKQPANWAAVSPRTFFGRIQDPIMIHHGTADAECPIAWSEQTVDALKAAGRPVTFYVYPGQQHTMTSQWPLSIRRSEAFIA